jgi:hypothetical protein
MTTATLKMISVNNCRHKKSAALNRRFAQWRGLVFFFKVGFLIKICFIFAKAWFLKSATAANRHNVMSNYILLV